MKAEISIENITNDYFLIRDRAEIMETMSVTNDAEAVVKFLYDKDSLGDKILYYIDTNDRVDILEHNKAIFTGFKPGFSSIKDFIKKHPL